MGKLLVAENSVRSDVRDRQDSKFDISVNLNLKTIHCLLPQLALCVVALNPLSALAETASDNQSTDITYAGQCPSGYECKDSGSFKNVTADNVTIYKLSGTNDFTIEGKSGPYTLTNIILAASTWNSKNLDPTATSGNPVISMNNNAFDNSSVRNNFMYFTVDSTVAAVMENGFDGRFWLQGTSIVIGASDPLIQATANSQLVIAGGNTVGIYDGASDYVLRSLAIGTWTNKYNFNDLTFYVSDNASLANSAIDSFGAQIVTNDLYLGSVVENMNFNVQFEAAKEELESQFLEYAATTYLDDASTQNRLIKLIRVKADENNETSITVKKIPALSVIYSNISDNEFSPRVYISGTDGVVYAATVATSIQGTSGYWLEIDEETSGQKGVYLNFATNGTSNIELLPVDSGKTSALVISDSLFKNSTVNNAERTVSTLFYGSGGFVYKESDTLKPDEKFAVTYLTNKESRFTGEVEVQSGILKISAGSLGSDSANSTGMIGYIRTLKLDEGAALYTDKAEATSTVYQQIGSLIIAKSYEHDEKHYESLSSEGSGLHLNGNRIDITGYDYNNPNSTVPMSSSIISRYKQENCSDISSIWSLAGTGTLGIREADVAFQGDNLKLSGTVLLEKGSNVWIDSQYSLGTGTITFTTDKTEERFTNRTDIATLIIDTSSRQGSLIHSGDFSLGAVINYEEKDFSTDGYVGRIELRDIGGSAFAFNAGSQLNHEIVLGNASLKLTQAATSSEVLLQNSKLTLDSQSQLSVTGNQSVRELVIGSDSSDVVSIDFGALGVSGIKTEGTVFSAISDTASEKQSGSLTVQNSLTINSTLTASVSVATDYIYNSSEYVHLLELNQSVRSLETLISANAVVDGSDGSTIEAGTIVGNVIVNEYNNAAAASATAADVSSGTSNKKEYFVQHLYDDQNNDLAAQLSFTGDLIVGIDSKTIDLGVQLMKVEINDKQKIQINQDTNSTYTQFTAQITEDGKGSVAVSVATELTIDNPANAFSGNLWVSKTEGSTADNAVPVLIVGSSGSLGSETEYVNTVYLGSGCSLQLADGVQQSIGDISLSDGSRILFGVGSKLSITDFSSSDSSRFSNLLSAAQSVSTNSSTTSSTGSLYTLSVNGKGQDFAVSGELAKKFTGTLEVSNLTITLDKSDSAWETQGLILGNNAVLNISDPQHSVKDLILSGGRIVTNTSVYSFDENHDSGVGLTVKSSLKIDSVSFDVHLSNEQSDLTAYLNSVKDTYRATGKDVDSISIFDQAASGKFLTLLNVESGDFEFDPNKVSVNLYLNGDETAVYIGHKDETSVAAISASESDLLITKSINDEKYTYTYGLGLSHDQNGIYLGYELTQIDISGGNVLSIDADSTTEAKAERLEVLLTGEGGIEVGSKAASVTLANSGNSFEGATTVDSNANLILGSNDALGYTSEVKLMESSSFSVSHFSQTVGALTIKSNSSLALGNDSQAGGTLTVSGVSKLSDNSKITLVGENSQLNLNGDLILQTSEDADNSVGPNIAIGEKSTLSLTLTSNLNVETSDLLSGNGKFTVNGDSYDQLVILRLNRSNADWSGTTVIGDQGDVSVVMNNQDSLGSSSIEVNSNGHLTLAWDSADAISLFANKITGTGELKIDTTKVQLTGASEYEGTVTINKNTALYISAESYFDRSTVTGNGELHVMATGGEATSLTLSNIGNFVGTVVVGENVTAEVSQAASTFSRQKQRRAAALTTTDSSPSYEIKSGASLLISGTASTVKNEGNLKLISLDDDSEVAHTLTVKNYIGSEGSSILFNIVQKQGEKAVADVLAIGGIASGQSSVVYNCESEDAALDGLLLVEYASAVTDYLSGAFKLDPSHTKLALGAEYFMLVPVQTDYEIKNFDYGKDVQITDSGYMLLNLATAENLIERLEHPERFDENGNRIVTNNEETSVVVTESGETIKDDSTALTGSETHTSSAIYRPEIGAYLAAYLAPEISGLSYADHGVDTLKENGIFKQQNAWFKQIGTHRHFKSGADQIKTHTSLGATMIGADLLSTQLTNKVALKGGLVGSSFYGRSRSSSSYRSQFDIAGAKTKTIGYSGGLYFDLIGKAENANRTLWYIEGWLQRIYSKNTVTSDTVGKEKFRGNGWMASAEVGLTLPLITTDLTNSSLEVSVEPKAQLIYENIQYAELKEKTGTTIKAIGTESLAFKLGTRLNTNWRVAGDDTKWQGFIDLFWNHQSKDRGVAMSATNLHVQSMRNTALMDIGTELTVKKNFTGWLKMGTNRSGDNYHEEHVVLGVKYRF